MVKAETPLGNPDWSDEENKRFDTLDSGTGLPAAQARRILGLEDAAPTPGKKSKPVYGPRQREIADAGFGDARVVTAREQTERGSEILDIDPAKRAYDLEQLRKLSDRFGGDKAV